MLLCTLSFTSTKLAPVARSAAVMRSRRTADNSVIIDAANVAFSAGGNEYFNVAGLQTCLEYFRELGYDATAVCSQRTYTGPWRKGREPDDRQLLQRLHGEKLLDTTPSGENDDSYMLKYAREHGSCLIVSNDKFRDWIDDTTDTQERLERLNWVKANVVPYSFVRATFVPSPKFNLSAIQPGSPPAPQLVDTGLQRGDIVSGTVLAPTRRLRPKASEWCRGHLVRAARVAMVRIDYLTGSVMESGHVRDDTRTYYGRDALKATLPQVKAVLPQDEVSLLSNFDFLPINESVKWNSEHLFEVLCMDSKGQVVLSMKSYLIPEYLRLMQVWADHGDTYYAYLRATVAADAGPSEAMVEAEELARKDFEAKVYGLDNLW